MKEEDIVEEAKDCLEKAEAREDKNRQRMREAIKFSIELDQWPDEIKKDRQSDGTPVFDKINQYVRRIVNEMRANTPAVKFRPVDDQGDPEIAKIYDGLWRHVVSQSDADPTFEYAGEYAVRGGFGFWRMVTEYCDPYSFDQDIRILRIPNHFSVLLGPHTHPTGCDAKKAVVYEDMPLADFKSKYPKDQPKDFTAKDSDGWITDETVRVAEYYKIVQETKTILLLDDGSVTDQEEYQSRLKEYLQHKRAAEAALALTPDVEIPIPVFPKPIKERKTVVDKVKWYKLTGQKVIDSKEVLGTKIPIFRAVGNFHVLPDGEIRTSGAVEAGVDSQRLHNYACAKFAQQVALAPTAPYVGVLGQFASRINDWKQANRKNISVLEYDLVNDATGQPYPAPQRQPMPGVPAGWQQLLLNTEHGIEAAFGMYGASVGGPSKERSGVALEQQANQGEMGTLHYKDNLAQAILQNARVFLEWAPSVYDTERVARILGEDGSIETVFLNPQQLRAVEDKKDQFGKVVGKSYNLNVGKYDVTATTGPSFMSKRQEGAAMMTEALRGNPELLPLIGHLYFKILDVPYADEIAEILKATAPPQVQEVLNAKQNGKEAPPPQVVAMMRQIDQASQELQARAQAVQEAEQQVQQVEAANKADKAGIDAAVAKLDAARKLLAAETQKAQLEIELAGRNMLDEVRAAQPDGQAAKTAQQPQSGITVRAEMDGVALSPQFEMVNQLLTDLASQLQQQTAITAKLAHSVSNPPKRLAIVKRQPDGSLRGEVG